MFDLRNMLLCFFVEEQVLRTDDDDRICYGGHWWFSINASGVDNIWMEVGECVWSLKGVVLLQRDPAVVAALQHNEGVSSQTNKTHIPTQLITSQ